MNEKPKTLTIAMQIPVSILEEHGVEAFVREVERLVREGAWKMGRQYLERWGGEGHEPPDPKGNGENPHVKEKV